jgi:hypothetical protein
MVWPSCGSFTSVANCLILAYQFSHFLPEAVDGPGANVTDASAQINQKRAGRADPLRARRVGGVRVLSKWAGYLKGCWRFFAILGWTKTVPPDSGGRAAQLVNRGSRRQFTLIAL